jgi:hypothetical protein
MMIAVGKEMSEKIAGKSVKLSKCIRRVVTRRGWYLKEDGKQ